jgi:hypothetical protein
MFIRREPVVTSLVSVNPQCPVRRFDKTVSSMTRDLADCDAAVSEVALYAPLDTESGFPDEGPT